MIRAAIPKKCARFDQTTERWSDQPQVRLVDERGGLERVVGPLRTQVRGRQALELAVDGGISRSRASRSPPLQSFRSAVMSRSGSPSMKSLFI